MVVEHALTNEEDEIKEIINIYTCMTVIFFFSHSENGDNF
jgi:hypothetical protein